MNSLSIEGHLACPEATAPSPLSLHQLPRLEPNDAESSQLPKPGVCTCARVPLGSGTQPWVPASQPPQAHSLLEHHPCSKRGNKNHGPDLPQCPCLPHTLYSSAMGEVPGFLHLQAKPCSTQPFLSRVLGMGLGGLYDAPERILGKTLPPSGLTLPFPFAIPVLSLPYFSHLQSLSRATLN